MALRSLVSIVTLLAAASSAVACSSSSNNGSSGGNTVDAGDAGNNGDDAGDASTSGTLSFKPSNLDLTGIDLSQITDEDTANSCQIRTGISDCFNHAANATITQSDGTKLAVFVVKSWKVEPTVHINLSEIGGNMPIAVVSLGDITIQGTIDGHAQDVHAAPGGFESQASMDGSGPGGGPKGDDKTIGAGGASYCGQGGQGSVVQNSGGTPGAKAAASGVPELVPLRGGASGGAGGGQGGAGGAGFQLVANGKFTMAQGSYINVGGGGGGYGTTGSGGGAGGSLLIEAQSITVAGTLAANGGGGGGTGLGADVGKNGTNDAVPAAGGPGVGAGGAGGAGATIDGVDAPAPTGINFAGGGGGGAGRIRLNSKSGAADLTGAVVSPPTTTPCVTQGTLK
jgi:hypothetical protein